MPQAVIVEDWTLEECRRKAAEHLGVPEEALEVRVIQKAKKGLFSNKPFRIKASVRADGGKGSPAASAPSGMLSKLNTHVAIALTEMEKIESLSDQQEGQVFDEILKSYDNLSDELRGEVQNLSKLISGETGKVVQERVAKDGELAMTVSEDHLQAFISVRPPEGIGRAVTMEAVRERMKRMALCYGVDEPRIEKLLAEVLELGQPVEDVEIARGRPAEAGKDGFIDFMVKIAGKEQVVREDGSVDYRGAAGITMVKAGQPLARLMRHTLGEPGMTVLGEAVDAQAGNPASLEAGENVVFDEESGEYRSAIDGVVVLEGNTLYVKQTYAITGDVDMTVGNIDFNGSISIGGSVRDGFTVRATGDIIIAGGVEGCEIVSEGGSVTVAQGVAGRGRCFVSAGRDVEAKYIENARVYARGDVKVGVAVMHSEVTAGNAVLATSGKGAIIGGTTKAGNLVQAFTLGAPNEPPTHLVLGVSDEDQRHLQEIDQRLVALKGGASRIGEVVKEFEHASTDVEKLPPAERERYVELRKKLVILHYEVEKTEKERQEFLDRVTAEAVGEVKAMREVYPRVVVRIGQYQDHVERTMGGTSFRADTEKGQIARGK